MPNLWLLRLLIVMGAGIAIAGAYWKGHIIGTNACRVEYLQQQIKIEREVRKKHDEIESTIPRTASDEYKRQWLLRTTDEYTNKGK